MVTTTEARYATRTVPRYTSYPTAPHFNAEVDGAVYGRWLAGLPAEAPVSLYLHVPYCRSICHYCGCHTKAARRDEPLFAYSEDLVAEIGLVAAAVGARRLLVDHVHWGGGTPSLLPAECFREVTAALRRHFDFRPGHEHAIELDPRTVTPDLAERLAEAGITRASLGVQDFDHAVQVAMGRVQPFSVVSAAVAALRAVGIDAINFDLMYGLPHQTADTIRETVTLATGLGPTRIALFGYAHVPWFKKHQRLIDETALPGAGERIELEAVAREALAAAGFEAIGLDHFARADDPMAIAARAGTLRRNFQGYTTDAADTLVGFGASSIGRMPQGFVQNDPDVGRWSRAVASGRLPAVKGKVFDADDRLRGEVIERLMCDYRVDLAAVAERHDEYPSVFDPSLAMLAEMVRDRMVRLDGWTVTMTEAGRPFVRVAAAAFDAYLIRAAARHSVAV